VKAIVPAAAIAVALLIAAVSFAYRFNTLGGTLGGFDNDEFAHLLRTEVLLKGELPLRDFADAELRGAWPQLSYMVPAWAQQAWGRTLLAEGYLTAGALALAYAVVFLVALDVSRIGWLAALLAAVFAVLTTPKLYNYPKVLALALGAAAIRLALRNLSPVRLAIAAAITAMAALFRHDYGAYLALAMTIGIVAHDAGEWRVAAKHAGMFLACTAVFLLPGLVWVQTYQGLVPYLMTSLHTSGIESSRTTLRFPVIDVSMPFGETSLVAFTYYAFWLAPVVALVMLAIRARAGRATPVERGTVAALVALALAVNVFFLRSNLAARFGDAVVPVAILAAWMAGTSSDRASRPARIVGWAAPAALLVALTVSAYFYVGARTDLVNSGVTTSLAETRVHFHEAQALLRQQPPASWADDEGDGRLRAARYLAECTGPDDRVLVAAYAPEVMVFAHRAFAGGQPTVSLGLYVSDVEQKRTLARLQEQSVPVVLVTKDYEDTFAGDYPLLARHLADRYREAGVISASDGGGFRVLVETNRPPRGSDPVSGLPCFR
jgi:hypothetical protein